MRNSVELYLSSTNRPEVGDPMSQSIEELVTALVEAWNDHDAERIATLCSPAYEGFDVAEPTPQRGQDGVRQSVMRYLNAFPDIRFVLEQTIIQGERVAAVWTATATHQGKLMNIPPTGRVVAMRGVSILTVMDSKISRGEYIWDVAGLLRAMRLLPEL